MPLGILAADIIKRSRNKSLNPSKFIEDVTNRAQQLKLIDQNTAKQIMQKMFTPNSTTQNKPQQQQQQTAKMQEILSTVLPGLIDLNPAASLPKNEEQQNLVNINLDTGLQKTFPMLQFEKLNPNAPVMPKVGETEKIEWIKKEPEKIENDFLRSIFRRFMGLQNG